MNSSSRLTPENLRQHLLARGKEIAPSPTDLILIPRVFCIFMASVLKIPVTPIIIASQQELKAGDARFQYLAAQKHISIITQPTEKEPT